MTLTNGTVDPQQIIYVNAREVHAVPVESVTSQPVYEPQGGNQGYPGNYYSGPPEMQYSNSTDNYYPAPPAAYGPGPQGYMYDGNQPMMVPQNQHFQQSNQDYAGFVNREYGGGVGICRRCGLQFNRPPNAHSSCAQYYRCDNCARLHVEDFCSIC